MYKLYLENRGNVTFINKCATMDDVWKEINHRLNLWRYHSHYFRSFTQKGRTYIDFGDWSRFFYYVEV